MANNVDKDEDVRDALGLYQQYLSQDVLAATNEAHPVASEDEQSVHSEEVQLYGQFMRSLITNEEDDGANEGDLDLDEAFEDGEQRDGTEPVLFGIPATDDAFIGKTVVTDSPSQEDETDEWLQQSLSTKNNDEGARQHEQDLLVADAKGFMGFDKSKAFQWDDGFGALPAQKHATGSSFSSGTNTPSRQQQQHRSNQSILPTYNKPHEPQGSTPERQATQEDDDTESPGRMYDVPWSAKPQPKDSDGHNRAQGQDGVDKKQSKMLKWLPQSTWSGRNQNDVEVPSAPSTEKPKSRFWRVVASIMAFFSAPMRCATAFMMFCHFVSSIIALTLFTRRRQCCGEVVDLESHGVFRIVSTVYFLWVLILILPVVVKGQVRFWTIPNPYFGFILASTLALHSFLWLAVSVFVLESIALTLQLVMVHMKDFRWRWVRLIVSLMPLVLCLAHVFLVFVDSAGQCVVNTKEGWVRTVDDACIICTGDDRPLILDKYRDPCLRPGTRYSSDIWGEQDDYCGSETNFFCFYPYAS